MQMTSSPRKQEDTLKTLFENNAESILQYNINILSTLILVSVMVAFVPFFLSTFDDSNLELAPLYLSLMALLLLVLLVFQLKSLRKRALLGVYLGFSGAFLFSIYMSVVISQQQRATIIIGLFCIFPMCIIDRPFRVSLFSGGCYAVHTALAFMLKGSDLAIDDAVNCFCFLTLGLVVGNRLIRTRVDAFETKRQLTLEKETDELTGLKNRRKLFQMIGEFDTDAGSAPSGVIMMDIDNFKEYNDQFGHAEGDRLLHHFGSTLLRYEELFNLQFFRYGGEEFTGFAWGYNMSELQSIFEALKVSINCITDCRREIGVSIGITDCKARKFKNYERYIDQADMASYRAKADGKNKVVCFDEKLEQEKHQNKFDFTIANSSSLYYNDNQS